MKKSTLCFWSLSCLLLLASCQAPVGETETLDMDAIKAEIQAMEDAYATSANAKDLAGQTAYYAEDAQSLAPNKPTLVGKAAILADIEANMAKDSTDNSTIRFEIVDLYAQGNLVVEVGKWITTNADDTETSGKYVSIFEKRDGKYTCIRDIYNSDQKENDNAPATDEVE